MKQALDRVILKLSYIQMDEFGSMKISAISMSRLVMISASYLWFGSCVNCQDFFENPGDNFFFQTNDRLLAVKKAFEETKDRKHGVPLCAWIFLPSEGGGWSGAFIYPLDEEEVDFAKDPFRIPNISKYLIMRFFSNGKSNKLTVSKATKVKDASFLGLLREQDRMVRNSKYGVFSSRSISPENELWVFSRSIDERGLPTSMVFKVGVVLNPRVGSPAECVMRSMKKIIDATEE